MTKLVIAQPWPLFPYSRRHKHSLWRRTRMFVVLVASSTEMNHCQGQKDVPCLRQTNQGYRCAALDMLYFFHPNFYSEDATDLVVRFLTSSKTTEFLPPLHTTLGRFLDQTKLVDGISLEIFSKVLIILNRSLINLASFCIGILLPPQCRTKI